jgi:hypothetical protein
MAINQNHLFEELNGVKCGIVEKNVKPDRLAFLRELLELNGFTVVAAPTPPPKAPPAPPPAAAAASPVPAATSNDPAAAAAVPPPPAPPSPLPETYTVGVTDITFNPINAIFGRLLRDKDGNIVTLAYWHQEEDVSRDDIPYFVKNK